MACNPTSLAAYRRAHDLLAADAAPALRARVLLGLAWNEASAGDPTRSEPLLTEAMALVPRPDSEARAEIATTRLITAIRLVRFADCESLARQAGEAVDGTVGPHGPGPGSGRPGPRGPHRDGAASRRGRPGMAATRRERALPR